MDTPGIPRRHRKRFSAIRLSSDTTTTLPEYTARAQQQLEAILPSDRPPDYPDSAEEGDADTSSEASVSGSHTASNTLVYVPQHYSSQSAHSSPRRPHYRRPGSSHKRKYPSPKAPRTRSRGGSVSHTSPTPRNEEEDPYLDALLERSVHALEMSNVLLQSSISTQTSLSTILASPDTRHGDRELEARALGLSSRIRGNKVVHRGWAEDLDEIGRDVEDLFEGGSGSESDELQGRSVVRRAHRERHNRGSLDSISSSLPTTSEIMGNRHYRRRPSLDIRAPSTSSTFRSDDAPQLRLSHNGRNQLVASIPRPLTQYIESTEDPSVFHIPSTLGLRNGSSVRSAPASETSHFTGSYCDSPSPYRSSSYCQTPSMTVTSPPSEPNSIYPGTSSSHNTKSASTSYLPIVTDTTPAPSTPAYNMLSSFVYRPRAGQSSSSTPSSFIGSSFLSTALSRRSSSNNPKSARRSSSPSKSNKPNKPLDLTRSEVAESTNNSTMSRSRSTTPKPLHLPNPASVQRSMTPPTEESSSDDGAALKTIDSLRKILDVHPSTSPPAGRSHSSPSRSSNSRRLKRPQFIISPPPKVEAGASTATASISRLYTKAKHTSSTRPPSPPRYSSLKGGSSGRNTPLTPGSPGGSSGRTTPKRISFAELPEGFPGIGGSKIGSKGKGRETRRKEADGSTRGPAWWATWLLGGSLSDDGGSPTRASSSKASLGEGGPSGMGVGTLTKSWGPRMGIGGGFEEWGV
ncbi:hypothetical protein CCMSSC00406_0001140 [Pleurotus cornucopiae]|uniref:Uncharacterized protein n=1 Tax=Pleurotus cornucopiae TaxID=5321 RepID=A0ACB7ILN6_PLECO|nr:hypothetical protein CCMSSC00406_0001140 [Pleurotus cornucopiae]